MGSEVGGWTKQQADLSSDMLLRQAMMTRGLACDQANANGFVEHERWVERICEARIATRPEGFARASPQQVLVRQASGANEVRAVTGTTRGVIKSLSYGSARAVLNAPDSSEDKVLFPQLNPSYSDFETDRRFHAERYFMWLMYVSLQRRKAASCRFPSFKATIAAET